MFNHGIFKNIFGQGTFGNEAGMGGCHLQFYVIFSLNADELGISRFDLCGCPVILSIDLPGF